MNFVGHWKTHSKIGHGRVAKMADGECWMGCTLIIQINPWGNAQLKIIDSDDESTHQILSYGLLFLTFYCFPYTAGPPTWPFPAFAWSPPTIPYTHRTIGPVPRRRPLIWPTDHIVTFPFLSLFSLPDAFFHGPTNRRSLHRAIRTLPYVSPHTNLVLILLIVCI